MDLLTAAVLIGAAVAAVARLVTREDGPWLLFRRLRNWAAGKGQIEEILTCPLCFGVYAAIAIALLVIAMFSLPLVWFVLMMPAGLGVAYALLGLAAMIQ